MTLTEKIIAKACGRSNVGPNDNVWVNTDVLMTHDVCGPGTIGNFYKEFGPKAKVNLRLTKRLSPALIFPFFCGPYSWLRDTELYHSVSHYRPAQNTP